VRVAQLSGALGQGAALLLAGWLACLIACGMAAWLGAGIAVQLFPQAKTMMIAIALVLAGLELLVLRPGSAPSEPTRSFGAILIVLSAAQVTGAAAFLVFALAAATAAPWLAAAGGALGGAAVLSAAWAMGDAWEAQLPLKAVRYSVAVPLLFAAIVTGLSVRGILG